MRSFWSKFVLCPEESHWPTLDTGHCPSHIAKITGFGLRVQRGVIAALLS